MNGRILKKLSKKAEPLVIALGLTKYGQRVVVNQYDEPVESNFVDYDDCKKGTVGYGGMSGYYEREGDDLDCYSMLYSHVLDHFFDWRKCDGETFPDIEWPDHIKRSPANIFKVARFIIAYEQSGKKIDRLYGLGPAEVLPVLN